MKAILISIRPQWAKLILNRIKKDEIRKGTAIGKAINKLIEEQGVAPMLIYCTKGNKNECLIPDLQPDKVYHPLTEKLHRGVYSVVEEKAIWNDCKKYILNGKVVARFNATAEHIEYETCSRDISGWWKDDGKMYNHKDACLTYEQMFNYIGAGDGTVIHINDLKIFDEPKEIKEFYGAFTQKRYERIFGNNVIELDKKYGGLRQPTRSGYEYTYPLTRAPQSWYYTRLNEE